MSTLKKLVSGSVARTAETVVTIITGIITLPLMLNYLGEDLYGLWILIGGFVASLYLFDFGFASSVVKYVTQALAKKDYRRANAVISTAFLVYGGLALVVLLVSCAIALFLPAMMENQERVPLAQVLVVITGFTIAVEFPFKAFAGVITGTLRHDLLSMAKIAIRLISTTALVVSLYMGYQLLAVALIQLATSLCSNVVFLAISKHVYPSLSVRKALMDRKTIVELSSYSAWAFLIDISRLVRAKSDIFIIGAYLGTSVLAVYYVATRLADYAIMFLGRATNMVTPIFVEQLEKRQLAAAKKTLILFLRLNFILGFLVYSCFITSGDILIEVWMGSDFDSSLAYSSLLILFSAQVAQFASTPMHSLIMANGTHQRFAMLTMLESLASILLMFIAVLGFDSGVLGVAVGLVLPVLVGRVFILPMFVRGIVSISFQDAVKALFMPSCAFLLATVIGLSLKISVSLSPLLELLVVGIGTGGSCILFNAFFLTVDEKGYLRRLLRLPPARVMS